MEHMRLHKLLKNGRLVSGHAFRRATGSKIHAASAAAFKKLGFFGSLFSRGAKNQF
jgi:hypothetical protein